MGDFVDRVSSGSMELSEALDMSSVALSVRQPIGDVTSQPHSPATSDLIRRRARRLTRRC
jgi:hypothetical protein